MADVAPLSSAHNHARKAGHETTQANWPAAASEHKQAAIDFQRSSRSTSDSEALRILKLLEDQHLKLARIISAKDDHDLPTASPGEQTSPTSSTTQPRKKAKEPRASQETPTTCIPPMRESSPSLAREIASRRGIPPPRTQAGPSTTRVSPEHRRTASQPSARIPSSIMNSQAQLARKEVVVHASDDGFSNFYNSITTGTMSKLSSVLAYAGLPLTAEGSKEEPPQIASRLLRRGTVKASTDLDVKQIFSKAALTAIEDDHKQRGLQGQAFGPAESFLLVPPTGGSMPYADMLKSQLSQQQQQQASNLIGGDNDEAFVDAQEAQPPSPRSTRPTSIAKSGGGKGGRQNFGSTRTAEELELENTTLKQTLEHLASRLANFEAHAQDASMLALTQSVANLRSSPATTTTTTTTAATQGGSDLASQERIARLEKHIEKQAEQRDKLEELARKQEKKIRVYHAKWEELKKNALEKDKVKRGVERQDGPSSASPS